MKRVRIKKAPHIQGLSPELLDTMKGVIVPVGQKEAKEAFLGYNPNGLRSLNQGYVILGRDLVKALAKHGAKEASAMLESLGLHILYLRQEYCTEIGKKKNKKKKK